jgi:hypothetical protein
MSHIASYPTTRTQERTVARPIAAHDVSTVESGGFESAIGVAMAWGGMYAAVILIGIMRAM